MLWIIFSCISILLSIVGLVDIFHMVYTILLKTNKNNEVFTVVPMRGNNQDAELILRATIERNNGFNSVSNQKIICLDLDMDCETKEICNMMSSKYKFITILTLEQFQNELEDN